MPPSLRRTYAFQITTDEPDVHPLMLPITRHHQYYLPGGDLFILIDNTLFRVHKYFFERESKTFFTQPYMDPNADVPLGDYGFHPIIIHDVEIAEFEQFLWVFYNPRLSIYENTTENWLHITRLATLWGFEEVLVLALRERHKIEELLSEPFRQQEIDYAYVPEDLTDRAMRLHFEDDHGA